jgi:hypothetical protein
VQRLRRRLRVLERGPLDAESSGAEAEAEWHSW